MTVRLIHGDCPAILPTLPADSFHAIVTDPPYGLEFMGKEWDKFREAPRRVAGTGGSDAPFAHHAVNPGGSRDRNFQDWCEAHRIVAGGPYTLSNTVAMCQECHRNTLSYGVGRR